MLNKKMKFASKFSLLLFGLMVIIQTASFIFTAALPLPALADSKPMTMTLEVPLPSLNNGSNVITFTGDTTPIAKYVKAIYTYAVAAVGIIAAVVMMIGGLMWITAGGNASSVTEAKSMIGGALTGMILVLTSYLILNQVNPALVNMQITSITSPQVETTASTAATVSCDWSWGTSQPTMGVTEESSGKVVSADNLCADKTKPSGETYIWCECSYEKNPNMNCSWVSAASNCSSDKISISVIHNSGYDSGWSPIGNINAIMDCGSSGYAGNNVCCCPIAANCDTVKQTVTKCQSCSDCTALPADLSYNDNSTYKLTHDRVQLNSNLITMLQSLPTGTFTITEAWPPTYNHVSTCHQNGTCIDLSSSLDAGTFATYLTAAGFTNFQYECKSDKSCCTGLPAAANCKYNSNASGPHFHVNMSGVSDTD
jgi:hypothetical protein